MAKGSNTWCKKLMSKAKRNALRAKLGSFQPRSTSSTLDGEINTKPKAREYLAPVKGYQIKPRRNRCVLNQATRSRLVARVAARDEFIKALRG